MNTKFTRFSLTALLVIAIAMTLVGSVSATLSGGSTFESGDGDLAPNTSTPPAPHDWNSPVEPISCPNTIPGTGPNCGLDLVKNQGDNAFGQGSKEDDEAPTVVFGSIPPSKDDLSRFYVNKERVGGNDYLYLAWERSNLLGSAHMDFELNQKFCDLTKTPTNCSANNITPLRTAGDLLIDFDFGGSGVPVLNKHTWITSGNAATDCEASNKLPCWDKAVNLGINAESQVNSAPVVDTNPPGAPRTLDGNTKNGINSTFGEAGVNLTGSGIFPTDVCETFGSATLKSRSSGNSFTSELKDFIAPIPVRISNCGAITIIKQTDARGVNQDFSYTTTGGLSPSTFTLNDSGNAGKTLGSTLPADNSSGNTQSYSNVFAGIYSVTEGADPTGFAFESLTCTSTGGGTSVTTSSKTANITLAPDGAVTCLYINKQQLGAIQVHKTSIKGTDLAGAVFSIAGQNVTTDASGLACVDNLPFGDYDVKEISAPNGYSIDDTTTHTVTVDNNAKCSDNPYIGEALSFSDTPLTDLKITVASEAIGGTSSTITCTADSNSANIGNSPQSGESATVTANGLTPGNYTCKVVIDP